MAEVWHKTLERTEIGRVILLMKEARKIAIQYKELCETWHLPK